MPSLETQLALDPRSSSALATLDTLVANEAEVASYDGALARKWQPLPSELRARHPQAAALSDGWGQRVEAAMAEQRSLVEARSALFEERGQVSAGLSMRRTLYTLAVLAAAVVLGVLVGSLARNVPRWRREQAAAQLAATNTAQLMVAPTETPKPTQAATATPRNMATIKPVTALQAAAQSRSATQRATRTPIAPPVSLTPPVEVLPYDREIEGDAAPEFTALVDVEPLSIPERRVYQVTIEEDTPVRLVRGWCGKDRDELNAGLESVRRELVIDGFTYDLGELASYDTEAPSGIVCQGWEGVVRRWPVGQHSVTSLTIVLTAVRSGSSYYPAGRYETVYNVNVVAALPTATMTPTYLDYYPKAASPSGSLPAPQISLIRYPSALPENQDWFDIEAWALNVGVEAVGGSLTLSFPDGNRVAIMDASAPILPASWTDCGVRTTHAWVVGPALPCYSGLLNDGTCNKTGELDYALAEVMLMPWRVNEEAHLRARVWLQPGRDQTKVFVRVAQRLNLDQCDLTQYPSASWWYDQQGFPVIVLSIKRLGSSVFE